MEAMLYDLLPHNTGLALPVYFPPARSERRPLVPFLTFQILETEAGCWISNSIYGVPEQDLRMLPRDIPVVFCVDDGDVVLALSVTVFKRLAVVN